MARLFMLRDTTVPRHERLPCGIEFRVTSPRPLNATLGTIMESSLKGQRLIAVFLLGCVAFDYPLFALFAGTSSFLGIPLLYVYVFFAWALLIALMALVIERPPE
jgi:hypothetical protein